MEEAAFIKEDLFYQVLVPLLGVEGTTVVAISTPDVSDDNYYSMLMDMRDPEDETRTLFKTIRIGLACEACVLIGKSAECSHKSDFNPPWKSGQRMVCVLDGRGCVCVSRVVFVRTSKSIS